MNLGHNEYFCEIHSVRRNSFLECLGYRRNPPYDRHSASWQQKDVFWDLALINYNFLTKMWYSARWTYTVYPEQAVVVRASVPVTIAMAKHNLRREEFISANDLWATVQGSLVGNSGQQPGNLEQELLQKPLRNSADWPPVHGLLSLLPHNTQHHHP